MINIKEFTIKNYVSSLKSVVRSQGEDTLGSVLSRVGSSHEAVFVFDDKEEFLGLISPYQTLYSSNLPYTTKVSSIVFKPPLITKDMPIHILAKHMLASKIYNLAVFTKKGVLEGVIYGKDIWQKIIKEPDLLDYIGENIKIHSPITAPIIATVKDVFHGLKEKGVSRMILLDDKGALAGIVSRGDLMHSKMKPTSKMRFSNEGTLGGYHAYAGEKKYRKDEAISKYYSPTVDSLPADTPRLEIVRQLISSPYNSLVLIDKNKRPTGFLSTRDIIQTLLLLRPKKHVDLSIKRPSDFVSDGEMKEIRGYLEMFGKRLKKRMEIDKIDLSSTEVKSPEGHTNSFNITLIVTPLAGRSIVATTKNRKFIDGVQEATKLIMKQRRRSGL